MTREEYEEKTAAMEKLNRIIGEMHISLRLSDRNGALFVEDEIYRTAKHGLVPVRRLTRKRRKRIKRLEQQEWYKDKYKTMMKMMADEMRIRRECRQYEKEMADGKTD